MKKSLAVLLVVSAVVLLFGVVAENIPQPNTLKTGSSLIEIDKEVYVGELVAANPQIEFVTYYDDYLGKQIAYVNVFGGIGQNFLMIPGKSYELSSKYEANLLLPDGNSVKIVE